MSEPYPFELQQARAAIWELAKFGGQSTQLAMRYIGLFVPVNDKLPFEQIYRLLCEINGICLDCSAEHWQKAVQSMLDDKISGSLKTPLQSHDILLERLAALGSDFFGDDDEPTAPSIPPKSPDPPRPYTKPTEQQKAKADSYVRNMMSAINKSQPLDLRKKTMTKKIKTQAIVSAQSRAEVVDKIAQMGVLQREILRLNAELNDQITPLKQACDEKVAKLQAEIQALSESCHIWCEANRAELTDNHRVKFADLSTGVVKWRIKNPSVTVSQKNSAEVIDRLLQDPNYKRFVREKLEINRELILQYPEMFEDNQILGIKIKRGEEDFVIEPNFDEVGA